MSLQYAYTPVVQFFDNDGNPLSNGELWTFNSITSASIQTYQDFLGTLNPTHVPLNSRGEAVVILDTAIVYKFALIPPNGDISDAIWIKDNIRASYGSTSTGSDITVVGTDGEVDVAQSSDGPTGVIYTVSLAQAVKDSLTSLANCVFYSAQSKTSSEQAIARTNIDVMSSSETMGAIQSAVASAVKLMGSATVAEINALANPVQGWLYQITDSGTITLGNVSVSAGDNIVYSSENSAWFKYYASIDLSSYYTKVEVNAIVSPIEADIDTLQTDVDIVESDVAALKLSDQYTTFKATTAAGSGGYTFKIATALKTKAPLTSTTILEYDLTNNYLGKINAAWGMRGHVVYQQIMQMDDQYTAVDYMHYTHLYEFPDRWELWGHTAAGWAGDISVRPSKNISIAITIHVNPWVFVGKAVSASLPTVYTEHNWVDYTQPVNNSKRTSVWAEGEGTSDHKVMIDANDQGAKYLNDKILTGGILNKAIEAAGEVGDWYEVLRLTATLYTDGVTCSGAGTSEDPLVATGDHKAMCSVGDIPGYLENKLVGSTWINASEIPLSSDEKNIMFALKNPDFFIKGNTIYGGTVVGVIGDLDEQSHNGYYTCYHSTLHAPPAQPGNPSWFVHHMNSNTANYYAVQIAYAYTSTIICYERTKVAGVWQAWTLRSSGSSEVAHIATGDSLGAKDIIQLQAGSSTQWSAHAAMCSTIGAITPSTLSKMGFIATQVVTGNFIIAAYKVETSLNHSLICSTGVTAFSTAGWASADISNIVKAISSNDRVYLVVLTDSNGVAMAGASCTNFNIQPYVAGIKTNMGVLTEAPATLTFDSETTSRPFIYMVK